ncbi:cation:proton antiporter [Planosporangium sp. 12N6]|uniref:cation:proton antiporter n=1 Tax=Planosporangium spinosum TaxID=3402278 RepID=UPI003CE76989
MTGRRWWLAGWGIALATASLSLVLVVGAGPSVTRSLPYGAEPVTRLLAAVAVTVAVCHLCGALATRLRQPAVVGEIVGGLLLGPSALGALWPAAADWLFGGDVARTENMAAQLGLVMFMFLTGRELGASATRLPDRAIGKGVAGSIGLPAVVGVIAGLPLYPVFAGPDSGRVEFAIFFGLTIAVTALPVLARLLADTRATGSAAGRLAITCAAVGDGGGWLVLTALLAVRASGSGRQLALSVSLIVTVALLTVLVVRPGLARLVRRLERRSGSERARRPDGGSEPGAGPDPERSADLVPMLLAMGAIGFAAVTQLIGLHAAIGAFGFGAILPRHSAAVDRGVDRLRGFVGAVLLPLFFASAGLHTDLGTLGLDARHWWLLGLLLVVAAAPKILGGTLSARRIGLPAKQALYFGALMNCRGVTEIIIATVGMQNGLINGTGFTMLVLLALLTTATTAPLARALSAAPSARRWARRRPGAGDGDAVDHPRATSAPPDGCRDAVPARDRSRRPEADR